MVGSVRKPHRWPLASILTASCAVLLSMFTLRGSSAAEAVLGVLNVWWFVGVPHGGFGAYAALGWWCVVVKVLDAPNLGYEHNVLTDMADRLESDGHPVIAAEYRVHARKAQEIYSHIAGLGRFTDSMFGDYMVRGVTLVNELLGKGWTPPAFLPVGEGSESW